MGENSKQKREVREVEESLLDGSWRCEETMLTEAWRFKWRQTGARQCPRRGGRGSAHPLPCVLQVNATL